MTFGHLSPGGISYTLVIDAAWLFGIPFTERLFTTLEKTPARSWIRIWHRMHRKYSYHREGEI